MHLLLVATLLAPILPVDEAQPNRQPAIASVPGLTAIAFGSGNSIWISTSRDNGTSFSQPTEVARVPVLALGRHRGPRVVISGSTLIVTAVYGDKVATGPHAHGLPAEGDLVAWRSKDGGHSWTKPVVINDVPGSAREGLHASASTPSGRLAAVWLDLRTPGTRLMGAYSNDGGETWSRNSLLYEAPEGSICQCCAPSLVFDRSGEATVMFRNVVGGARDMYLLRWPLGGEPSKPQKVGTGSWTLNACPMDGGGIAQWGGATVAAWRRDKTIYLTEPGRPEFALGEGKDVTVAIGAHGPYVAWTGSSGIELYGPGQKQTRLLSSSGAFAAMRALPNGSVLVAWEEGGRIQLETVE